MVVRAKEPASVGFPENARNFTDVRDEILWTAATRYGIGIGCNGVEADIDGFRATGIPALYERLAPGALEGKYRLELADDWPMWVNAERRARSSVNRTSDNASFQRCLENAVGVTPGLPRLPIGWMKLLEPDLDCTNPNHPDYQPACEQKLIWLKRQLLPPPADGEKR